MSNSYRWRPPWRRASSATARPGRPAWGDEARLNAHVEDPRVGLAAIVVIADTDARAEETYLRASEVFGSRLLKLWHDNDDHKIDKVADAPLALRTGAACVGSPRTVRDLVAAQVEASGVNYFEAQLLFGDMTLAEGLRSLRSFAEVVMPAVGDATATRVRG